MLVATTVALVVNIVLNVLLIPSLAGTAAALATTVAYAVEAAIGLGVAARLVPRLRVLAPFTETPSRPPRWRLPSRRCRFRCWPAPCGRGRVRRPVGRPRSHPAGRSAWRPWRACSGGRRSRRDTGRQGTSLARPAGRARVKSGAMPRVLQVFGRRTAGS